jgi:hypothetical protein
MKTLCDSGWKMAFSEPNPSMNFVGHICRECSP